MTNMHTAAKSISTIQAITEPVILAYFQSINREEYGQTASLFADNGILHPPFEEEIVGREAIATYLATEAKGMKLEPQKETKELREDGYSNVLITGQVSTPLFSVRVAWEFVLNQASQILGVRVKLLASPQELLKLRR